MILRELSYVVVDEDLLEEAGRLQPPTLRSLDALHLASALSVRGDLSAFVAYDRRLREAATAAGLVVRTPGAATGF